MICAWMQCGKCRVRGAIGGGGDQLAPGETHGQGSRSWQNRTSLAGSKAAQEDPRAVCGRMTGARKPLCIHPPPAAAAWPPPREGRSPLRAGGGSRSPLSSPDWKVVRRIPSSVGDAPEVCRARRIETRKSGSAPHEPLERNAPDREPSFSLHPPQYSPIHDLPDPHSGRHFIIRTTVTMSAISSVESAWISGVTPRRAEA